MGRQVNFYMSESDQRAFVEYVLQERFVLLDYEGKAVGQAAFADMWDGFLYKAEYGALVMREGYGKDVIDGIKSPVIEFTKTILREEEKRVQRGRIWMESRYYDGDGAVIKKGEGFLKDYQRLARWIKKRIPYQTVKTGEYVFKEYVSDALLELQDREYRFTL